MAVLRADAVARSRHPLHGLEPWLSLVVVGALALRVRLPMDIPLGFVVAILVLPMSLRYVRRYRGATLVLVLVVAAAISGLILTMAVQPFGDSSSAIALSNTTRILGLGLSIAAILWARTLAGTRRVVVAFGVGALASLAFTGLNEANIWKYSLSLPITLIVLSLPWVYRRRLAQTVAALILVLVCAALDSRSAAGFLLVALAVTVTQGSSTGRTASTALQRVVVALRIASVGVGGFLLLQAAFLDGIFGEGIQERTEAQIATSGSLLTGGRPEIGASVALITAQPWGYGSGAEPTMSQILTAKTGMAALGYDPNNGYVENYMFGSGFELHSMFADFWILFGIVGLLLACAIIVLSASGQIRALSVSAASTIGVYLTIRLVWDFAFSPIVTSFVLLPLCIAVSLAPRGDAPVRDRMGPAAA